MFQRLPPGTHKWKCPECGEITTIEVPDIRMGAVTSWTAYDEDLDEWRRHLGKPMSQEEIIQSKRLIAKYGSRYRWTSVPTPTQQ